MRNIFDQYFQPENRVTHALMTALREDRTLLRSFLRDLVGVEPPCPPTQLSILEQQYPGEDEPSEDELERRGIPDGWIFDTNGWCVLIESKVLSKLNLEQIERHRRTAARRGFQHITAVAITPVLPFQRADAVVLLEWRSVYVWLCKHSSTSVWAKRVAVYFEIAEAKLSNTGQFREGTLTTFSGFPFGPDHPFTYLEGKRLLQMTMRELRQRRDLRDKLKVNANAPGRSITDSGDAVWDFLSLAAKGEVGNFTNYPHLTLGIAAQSVEAMVTIPNAVNNKMRRKITDLGEGGFQSLIENIVRNFRPVLKKYPGSAPWGRGIQRRYPSQRARPFIDARIDFDLRTAIAEAGSAKLQPRWLSAAYSSFVNRKATNYQMQVGVVLRYDRCPALRKATAINLIAEGWLACKPLTDLAR